MRKDGDTLLLRVEDTGPGLSPETASRAFERGWSTKQGGADRTGPARLHGRGLGLALVGQTVQRLRGSVAVSQGREGGAVFEIRLPLRARVRR